MRKLFRGSCCVALVALLAVGCGPAGGPPNPGSTVVVPPTLTPVQVCAVVLDVTTYFNALRELGSDNLALVKQRQSELLNEQIALGTGTACESAFSNCTESERRIVGEGLQNCKNVESTRQPDCIKGVQSSVHSQVCANAIKPVTVFNRFGV